MRSVEGPPNYTDIIFPPKILDLVMRISAKSFLFTHGFGFKNDKGIRYSSRS